ncbi:MAG TPA: hypothetical protein VGL83_02640 [Stellaceae bacterium]|jgi:hypothetical protein
MKANALLGMAAASLVMTLSLAACADDVRHSPEAHMDQNADRYRYSYDDGVCSYDYRYDFKTLTDQLQQHGDCRNVPIQRYRPQAAIVPAFPSPAATPPVGAPAAAPSVIVGTPAPARSVAPPPGASPGIAVTPLQ